MQTFFLTTVGEYSGLTVPRQCEILDRVRGYNRDDYMLVKISPPLSGQDFNMGGEDIGVLLLSTVLSNTTLFPIKNWPVGVYVARPKDKSIIATLAFTFDQVDYIAKGFIFQKLDEANAAANRRF